MPRFLYTQARIPGRPERIARSFALLVPVDWYDFVPDGDKPGLAVLVVYHGGNGTAEQAIIDFNLEAMFDGGATTKKPKLAILVIQGISIGSGGGGDFNGGLVSRDLQDWVDDGYNTDEALALSEQILIERYIFRNGSPPPTGFVYDRGRIAFWGFSNGARMAYYAVTLAGGWASGPWTPRAIVACSSTIGGWYTHERFAPVALGGLGLPADVLYSPPASVSILAIHGKMDDSFPWDLPGTGTSVESTTKNQLVLPANWELHARADMSAIQSVDDYIAVAAVGGVVGVENGDPIAAGGTGLYAPPVPIAGAGAGNVRYERAWEEIPLGGGTPTYGAYLFIDSGLGHAYPDNTGRWGPMVASTIAQYFLQDMVPLDETY